MSETDFDIPASRYFPSELVRKTKWFWKWLGDIESKTIRNQLKKIELKSPVYISGLARSGSTIILRMLASLEEMGAHQYRDFPFLYIPYWWSQATENDIKGELEPAERAHEDRIKVTPFSPESREETLWMAFFDDLHNPLQNQIMKSSERNSDFESFYIDHLKKIRLIRDADRYLSKANYNLTRLPFLKTLFPETKFIVPIRHPYTHIASSRKQHHLFNKAARKHPRIVNYLKHVGHFEFGPHRKPINAGNTKKIKSIQNDWENGRDIRGWAKYWSHLYRFLKHQIENDSELKQSCKVIRYEDLCDDTEKTIQSISTFLDLEQSSTDKLIERYKERICRPDYYETGFSEKEQKTIWREVEEPANYFGYEY